MLRSLIRASLDNAPLMVVFAILILAVAARRVPDMAVDVFPELNAPTVVILTEASGYAAPEVEQYVTFPIESAVNGTPGVRRVRSSSAIGLSVVRVSFDWGVDIYRARYLVSERLSLARDALPDGVRPIMTPVTSITGEIMLISLSSELGGPDAEPVSELDLRAFGEFELRNRLLAVPGVAQVVAIGGELPEYQIHIDPVRLRHYDLTMNQVIEAARGAHSTAGAGYLLNVDGLELPLRQSGQVTTVDDIRETVVARRRGSQITIGEVADVRLGGALKRGTGSEAGRPAVILSVQKAPGTNTLALTESLDEVFDQLEPTLPPGVRLNRHVMRQSDFIEASLSRVIEVSRDAAIIVCIVIALFLMNVRATLITLVAIPLSIATSLLILDLLGETINVMTLGGLAVAIGVVVDDGIIDVENVFRRLAENRELPPEERSPLREVVFNASNEIRSSIVFATLIIVIVFLPLLFLQGLEGRFFRPLGTVYILAVGASLIVAMTVTPALCYLLLRVRGADGEEDVAGGGGGHGDGVAVRILKRLYVPLLESVLSVRRLVLGAAIAATIAALLLASTFGTSFLPEFNEGTFTIFLLASPGTSLEESDRIATGIERKLAAIPGVNTVARRTGRAERDEHAEPVSNSEIEVTLNPGVEKEEVKHAIDEILTTVPGITTMIGQPIEHRLSHIMSGTPAAVAINVYGEDLNRLRSIAAQIKSVLEDTPGARDINAQREITVRSLEIVYRRKELARWGLSPVDAAAQVQSAIDGAVVGQVNEGVRLYDIVVRLEGNLRTSIEQVRELQLSGADGSILRLRDVADVRLRKTPAQIARENIRRKAVISANVGADSNLGHLVARIRERVEPIVLQASRESRAAGGGGYSVEFGGQFEAQQSASRTILIMGCGVAVVMLLLLQLSFGAFKPAVLVMANLPLSLIGGILAIFLAQSDSIVGNFAALVGVSADRYHAPVISIAGMVGFVTLFGIAVRNGILLVNHVLALEAEGLPRSVALRQGAIERLVPILMTALTAVLGLIPLALAAGEPGSELLAPLALVVLGGLVSSTFLNLVVIPAGYAVLIGGGEPEAQAESEDAVVAGTPELSAPESAPPGLSPSEAAKPREIPPESRESSAESRDLPLAAAEPGSRVTPEDESAPSEDRQDEDMNQDKGDSAESSAEGPRDDLGRDGS